jgi:hypothetical protein
VHGVLSSLVGHRQLMVHLLVTCCSEMLAAGLLNEGNAKTRAMARFGPGESPRSVQLYGVEVGEVRSACGAPLLCPPNPSRQESHTACVSPPFRSSGAELVQAIS